MTIYDAIKSFNEQFAWEPEIVNGKSQRTYSKFVVCGMGGSNLAAGLLKIYKPELQVITHRDYSLPALPENVLKEILIIASSYSGNTEEAIDAFETAGKKNLTRAAISIGGKLLEMAKKEGVPYIQMPDTGIEPRSALGFSFKGLLKIIGEEDAVKEVSELARILKPAECENEGKALAKRLKGFIPIIYSSSRNEGIAYNWKIKFNETGKIPAFCNVFPELNHNEMNSFAAEKEMKYLSEKFYFIFLKDATDHPRIQKRMEVMKKLFNEKKLTVETLEIKGENALHKIFSSLILADWTAYYLALAYGVEPNEVPMVEEFKKLIA
jgi:glucose/mannose-6-phosphate isomerase